MKKNNVKVSVITTTLNDEKHLKNIIDQMKMQDYSNLEYIIVDGGSTDGTLDLIMEAKQYFGENLAWISEQDTGIYEAINKGIILSTGDIIGCCFDEFTSSDVIRKMVAAIEVQNADGVHGDLHYVKDNKIIRKWHQGQGNIRFGWMPGHPTLYLKKEVYETYGMYKANYKVSADYEFMVRCLKDKKVTLAYIPEVLINMRYGGTSNKNLKAYLLSLKEGHRALKENGVSFAWFTDMMRIVRVLLQFR